MSERYLVHTQTDFFIPLPRVIQNGLQIYSQPRICDTEIYIPTFIPTIEIYQHVYNLHSHLLSIIFLSELNLIF